MTFDDFFIKATGIQQGSFPYQRKFATVNDLPALVRVPTGLGKTAMAILGWVWRRRFADEAIRVKTPRRLVYCLPMRVLVEQTRDETIRWLHSLCLLAGNIDVNATGDPLPETYQPPQVSTKPDDRIAVHLLMGGEDRTDWALWPECDAILIGTQDMLLSRALNRGYAAGRTRWPMEFGLLNNDCLWVFDEVQLMSTALATSLQLNAWRSSLRLRPARNDFPIPTESPVFRPCKSVWMSATMAKHWLETAVDWKPHVGPAWEQSLLDQNRFCSGDRQTNQRVIKLFKIEKTLHRQPVAELKKSRSGSARTLGTFSAGLPG